VSIKIKRAQILKITRNTADIAANMFLAIFSGRYIFNIHASTRPPSKLATGNKFKAAYIILVKNANMSKELFPAPCIIKKIKSAKMIFKKGPPTAIKISVLYGASPFIIILTPHGVISTFNILNPLDFIKIICPNSCITIQAKIINA